MNLSFRKSWVAASAVAALFVVASVRAGEVPTAPTFTKDVLPILQARCQDCHRTKPMGTSGMVAPMSLMTYDDVRPWAKSVVKNTKAKVMPPWFASAEFHGVFRNERTLNDQEIATIEKWVATGAPKGEDKDAPAAKTFKETEWWVGKPDLIVPLPKPVWVGDEVQDWQPNIDVKLTEDIMPEDRWMKFVECQPGSPVVHHIVLYTVGGTADDGSDDSAAFGGYQIGGLAPGAEPSLLQDGYGILIKKGSTLRVNMHYHKEPGTGTGCYDQSRLGFFFYPKDAKVKQVHIEPVGSLDFEIPPNKDNWLVGMARTFDRPFTVLNYLPHTHLRGVAAEYTAFYPDGKKEKLLEVPKYDYNWQLSYEYPEPKKFPAGTRIEVKLWYDNTTKNPSNPDPNKAVKFGIETTNEMAFGWMYYSFDDQKQEKEETPGGAKIAQVSD